MEKATMKNENEKVVVVLSGGLDSSTLLYDTFSKYSQVYAISFEYGQKHSRELEFAKYHSTKLGVIDHKILDITFMKDITKGASALTDDDIEIPHIKDTLGDPQPISYVPNRNMIMLSIAASYAEAIGATRVLYGAQAHDTYSGYWDASPEFLPQINNVLQLNRRNKIAIEAPFVLLKKPELIKLGSELGLDYSMTTSCYNGHKKACGTCPTCSDRIKAFMDAGVEDPIEYETAISWPFAS